MKKLFSNLKFIFTLLAVVSLLAITLGIYLGITLGTSMPGKTRILPFLGITFWTDAWVEFMVMCLRLRKGDSAFTAATEKTLHRISCCMVGLAVVTICSAVIAGNRLAEFWMIELIILPGIFLAAAVAAKILRGLLLHAMALEKEQKSVV